MGQTITIGANQTSLTDFSFILNPHNGGTSFDFTGNVALWNASTSKIGATLFTSSPVTYPAGNAYDDGVAVGFGFTSNLTLTQGNQYAFFLSSYGSNGFGDATLASNNANPYSGGQFIFNSGNPSSNSWEMWLNNLDARLKVNFASVPQVPQLADISGITPKLASELGLNYNPVFTGGSLKLDQVGQTFNQNFTLAGSGNAIDLNGNTNAFTGTFQNAVSGTPIDFEFKNSGSGGSITFSNDIGASGNSVGTIKNSTNWNLIAGADVFANGINNSGSFNIAVGATVTDDLNNTGYLFNSGTYNANLTNDSLTAQIWNDTTGVWNGDVLSNTNGASIFNFGQWNGNANSSATIENNVAASWIGNITNNSGGLINNFGILDGTVTNAGTVDNQSGGTITGLVTNTGAFHNLAGSSISGGLTQSSGTSTNAGVISNASGTGVSLSGGLFTNGTGGILNNGLTLTGGSFVNQSGATINGGLIYSSTATSNNVGTLNGGATINSGRLNNMKNLNGAVVLNSGANLVNYSTGVITGDLMNNSGATVSNSGAINGDVTNNGTLNNNLGASINGTFYQNDGDLTNNGTISGDVVFAGGTITNNGTMDSPLSSAITANGGSLITNNATGVIGTYANTVHGIFSTSAVSIDNSGSISAGANSNAKAIATVDGTIINRAGGTINGESAGVYNTGTLDLTNSGTINGNLYHGVYSGGTAKVVNNNTITGGINAIYSVGALDLYNKGSMSSLGDVAISNSAGSTITNAGTITSSLNSAVVVGGASTITNAIGGVLTGGSSGTWGAGVQMAGESGTVNNYGVMNGTAGGIISNHNLGFGGPGGVLNINLFAGSTTGNINLTGNSGRANVTLYSGLGTANTGLTDGFGTQLQNAGTLAGAVFGNIYGNSGANQSLFLTGSGNGTSALGAIGTLDVGKIFNLAEINKTGTGIWRLNGNYVTPGMTINAGNGSPSGVLQFNATGLAGDINVNGAVIQALASGAFGSGTIHMIDPTIQFSANGTYSNNISLEVPAGQVATDPATFMVDSSVLAFLSGEITQSSAGGVDPNQDFVKTGAGTLVLQNTNNAWSGVTKVLAGRLAGQTDTISGSSIINNGVVEINQIAGGTLNQDVSGTGYIEVNSLADGNAINFAGNITQNLNNNSMGDIILSGAANNSSVVSQVAGSSVTLANGAANNVGAANAFKIADGVNFENYGTTTSNGDNAIYAQNGGTINNYASGVIRADGAGNAIFGDGVNAINIYNYGNISASAGNASAIELSSTGANYIYNQGSISGDIGITFNAGGTLVNSSTGSITGTTTGILVNNAAVDLTLDGTLVGGIDAIKMVGNFNNTISLNSGSNTSGNITFDSGDDFLLINTGANFSGNVNGGAGTDSYELTGTGTNTIDAGSFSNFELRTKTGSGTWTLTGNDNITADFGLLEGTLVLSGGSAMNDAANVTTFSGSTLQLASNETIGGLSGTGNVDLQNYLLVLGANNSDQLFSGTISGNGGSLTKVGSGVFNLIGSHTFGGLFNVLGGTLNLDGSIAGSMENNAITNAHGSIGTVLSNYSNGVFNVDGNLDVGNYIENAYSAKLNVLAGNTLHTNYFYNSTGTANGLDISGILNVDVGLYNYNGATIKVNNGATINAGYIWNQDGGYILVDQGGTVNDYLDNNGGVDNNGHYNADVNNYSTGGIYNYSTGVWTGNVLSNTGYISNDGRWVGTLNNSVNGYVDNYANWRGSINNNGYINNAATGDWRGQFNNQANGLIDNNGYLFDNTEMGPDNYNSGTINNNGTVEAKVHNYNIINNNFGAIWYRDLIENLGANAIVTNDGTWNGYANNEATINNNGTWNGNLDNYATINNNNTWNGDVYSYSGTLTNNGTWNGFAFVGASNILNNGTFNGDLYNDVSGNVANYGTWTGNVENYSTIFSYAGSTWAGDLINDTNGIVSNSGDWTGEVVNRSLASITNNGNWFGNAVNAGTITTNTFSTWSGELTNQNGGVVDNQGTWNGNANNLTGATIINRAAIVGSVINAGSLSNNFRATISNAVTNSGTLTNGGTLNGGLIQAIGSTNNSGTINLGANISGGSVLNTGIINGGLLQSAGTITSSGTINAGASVTGGTLNTTGTINGGVTNSAIVNASNRINGAIINQGSSLFTVTGNLIGNSTFTNNGTSQLFVTGGNYTGLTGLVNNSSSVYGVAVSKSLGVAGNVANNAGASIRVLNGGRFTANNISNAATATILVDVGGTIIDSLNNSGTVSNFGTYTADVDNIGATATISNNAGGVWNGNVLSNVSGATIINSGTWNGTANNSANLGNLATGIWNGAITNNSGALLQNNGTINGAVTNSGNAVTTGTINGAVTNNSIVNAQGAVNGAVLNQASGTFVVTGALTGNSSFTNNGAAQLLVTGGNYTGLTNVTNNSTHATGVGIAAGRTLSAANVTNASGATIINQGVLTSANPINNAGTIASIGIVNGGVNNAAGGLVQAQNQFNGPITNSGNFVVSGALTNNASAFTNNASGILAIGGNNFTGLGAIANAGLIGVGTSTTNGLLSAASMSNTANVYMANNSVGDRINLTGSYVGSAGSVISFDLNMGSNSNLSDKISAASNTGTSVVSLNNLATHKTYFSNPIVLMSSLGGGGTLTAATDAQTNAALASVSIVDYELRKLNSSNDWGVVSKINTAMAVAPAVETLGFLSSVANQYEDKNQINVATIDNGKPLKGKVWLQINDSNSKTETVSTPPDQYSSISNDEAEVDLLFVRVGADSEYKFPNGMKLRGGVDGGIAKGKGHTQLANSGSDLDMNFVGLHGELSNKNVQLGAAISSYSLDLQSNVLLSNKGTSATGIIANINLKGNYKIGRYDVTPHANMVSISGNYDNIALDGGIGELKFDDFEFRSAKLGVAVSRNLETNNNVISPYVDVYYGNDTANKNMLQFVPLDDVTGVSFKTSDIGSYVGYEAGLSAVNKNNGLEIFAKVKGQNGGNIKSLTTSIGAKIRF